MVEVIVPWKGGCPHRECAWEYLSTRYPWPVTVAEGGDPWVKARAVHPAIEASTAEIIVLADADVWCYGLEEAVEQVRDGAPWAIPHRTVHRLTEASSGRFYAGEAWQGLPVDRKPYLGVIGGGYVIARRDVLRAVPLDPRFVGWGNEDISLGLALQTLVGIQWRGDADLIHLWHPPAERMTIRWGSVASRRLCLRYLRARLKPELMNPIVEEARLALQGVPA